MEIKLNTNVDPVGRMDRAQPKKVDAQVESEGVAFSRAEKLNQALRDTPEVRTDSVAKGQAVVSQTEYPPKETIKKIATLLAVNLAGEKNKAPEL